MEDELCPSSQRLVADDTSLCYGLVSQATVDMTWSMLTVWQMLLLSCLHHLECAHGAALEQQNLTLYCWSTIEHSWPDKKKTGKKKSGAHP